MVNGLFCLPGLLSPRVRDLLVYSQSASYSQDEVMFNIISLSVLHNLFTYITLFWLFVYLFSGVIARVYHLVAAMRPMR